MWQAPSPPSQLKHPMGYHPPACLMWGLGVPTSTASVKSSILWKNSNSGPNQGTWRTTHSHRSLLSPLYTHLRGYDAWIAKTCGTLGYTRIFWVAASWLEMVSPWNVVPFPIGLPSIARWKCSFFSLKNVVVSDNLSPVFYSDFMKFYHVLMWRYFTAEPGNEKLE